VALTTHPPKKRVPGLTQGLKGPRRGVDHPPHLAPRLKKEYLVTSTPPLGGPSWPSYKVNLTSTIYNESILKHVEFTKAFIVMLDFQPKECTLDVCLIQRVL
jgi:hypothetical protein